MHDFARDIGSVSEIINLVAEPLVVDELSLIRAGPIRVQARCRNPQAINCSIEIFFNGDGVPIRFEVESGQGSSKGGKGGRPRGGRPDDSHKKDPDNNHKGGKFRKNYDKFDRIGKVDREMDSCLDGSMEEKMEQHDQKSPVKPLAAFHPELGLVNIADIPGVHNAKKDIGQMDCGDKIVESKLIPSNSQFLINSLDGPYLMNKDKWLVLKLPSESQDNDNLESLTQEETLSSKISLPQELGKGAGHEGMDFSEEDFLDNIFNQGKDSDVDNANCGWQTSKGKKTKRQKRNQVVVATRTSSRVPRDGIPIAEKASMRAKARDDTSGMNVSNPFTVLNNTPDAILHEVINDLDLEVSNIDA